MQIKRVYPRFVLLNPEYTRLRAQYTAESGMKPLGRGKTNLADYDDTKMIAVMENDKLVGFSCIRLIEHPHHVGRILAAMDALYIEPSSRKGRAGVNLLNETKAYAKDCGAVALTVSAPYGSRLAKMLRLLLRDDPVQEVFCISTETTKGKHK